MRRTAVICIAVLLLTAVGSLIIYKNHLQVEADIKTGFNERQLTMARLVGRDAFAVRKERAPGISFEEINRIMREKMMKGESGVGTYISGWQYSVALATPEREVILLSRENFLNTLITMAFIVTIMLSGLLYILSLDRRRIEALEREAGLAQEIKESRDYLQDLLETANDLVYTVDIEGKMTYINPRIKDYGYTPDELLGRDFLTLLAEKHKGKRFKKTIREGVRQSYEVEAVTKGGEVRHCMLNTSPVMDTEGKMTGLVGILRDVTEKKKAEEEVRQSEEKYRTIIENIVDVYYEVDLAGNLTFFNDSACEMIGLTRDELMGMNNRKYMDEETAKEVYQVFNEVYNTGKPIKGFEYEIIVQKDGSKRYVESSVSLIKNLEGQPIGFRGVIREITERKEAEEELRQSEEKYRTIIESIEDGYYEVDIAGNFTFFNDSLVRMVGYSEDELMGVNYRQYTPAEDTERVYQAFNRVFTTGKPLKGFDWEFTRKDGSKIQMEVSVSLVKDSEGQPIGFRGVVRDITERVHLEKKIKESEERYRHLIEHANAGIVLVSGEYFVFANKKISEMVGHTVEELTSTPFLEFIAPRDRQLIEERYRRRQRGEKLPQIYDFWMIRRDGTEICVELDASLTEVNGEIATLGVMRDITEKKKAEEALRESEEKYRTLADSSITGVFTHQDSKFVFVNDRFTEMHGYEPEELLGRNHLDLIHPDQREIIRQRADKRLKGEEVPQRYEIKRLKKDGEAVWHEVMVSDPIMYRGRPAIMGHEIDITERKKAEEILRYFKEYNEKIVASIPSSLLILDRNLNIKSVNRTYLEIGGVKHEDVVGRNIKEVFPGHLLKEGGLLKAFEEVMETGEPFRLHDVRHTSTHHPEKILNFTVSGIRVEEEAMLILVIEDITERARLREEIRKSRDFMDTIFKTSVDIVATTDERGIITFVNRAMEKIAGYKEEELIGRHVSELYDRGLERAKDIMGILTSGQALKSYRLSLLTKQGKEIPVSISGSLLKDSQGRVIGTLGFIRDVSRLVEAEEELRKKNEELENFVYVVSHDLKSPIVSMQGFSSMLLNDYGEKLGERGERYIERIRANASRMEVLISDLLALSRIGRVVSALKDISSLEIANRVCNGLKSRMEENRIEVFIGDDLPIIQCDGDRIYQVFENLVVNAIKFIGDTQEPKIEIGYEEKEGFHQFYVRDNGIGIDPKYHSKIFEIFQRLKEVEDEKGTGIGLVIVERIVKNHGGKVWVESQKGEGATFYFTLPKMPS